MAGTFDEGDKLRRWFKGLEKPEKALKQIGILMVAESTDAFKAQQFGRERWPARGKVNVYGIISDMTNSKTPPARRFQDRPVLKDTGRLSSTIAHRLIGTHEVEVGSNLPYSGVHNYGGKVESDPITETVQKRLSRWLRTQPFKIQSKLAWLLRPSQKGKTLKTEVPAREFVGINKQTVLDIVEVVGDSLFGDDS